MNKNLYFILTLLFSINLSTQAQADIRAHDFRSQIWAKGRSCSICHVIKNGLPSLTPPGSRLTVDNANLTPQELQAVELNPSNRLCYVCHKTNQDSNGHLTASQLPVYPTGPTLNPSVGAGTFGSIDVRVNNQGAKGLDCLGCHDVHNKNSDHLIRADFGMTPTNP